MSRSRNSRKNPYDSDVEYEVELDRIKPYSETDSIDNYVPPSKQELEKMIMKNKKNQRKQGKAKRVVLIILLVLLLLIAALAATFLILQNKGKKDLMNFDDMSVSTIDGSVAESDGKTITYKGRTYRLNENITSIACLGVDKEELMAGARPGTAGQSDTNIVLVIDTAKGTVTAINSPRDTMCDVNVFTVKGNFVNTTHEQLCMAYAYGDGKKTSCENAVASIERVLFGMPINSYISLDTDNTDFFEFFNQFFQIVRGQFCINLVTFVFLHTFQSMFKQINIGPQNNVTEHHDKAAIRIICKSFIICGFGQRLDRVIVKSQIQHGIHHTWHRNACPRTYRHQ